MCVLEQVLRAEWNTPDRVKAILATACLTRHSCNTLELTLFILLAVVLGVAGLWLLCRGIFFDRARGAARCCQCWYPLIVAARPNTLSSKAARDTGLIKGGAAESDRTEIEPTTCAECGTVHTFIDQTLRTRRSKARIGLGIVLITLALATPTVPGVRANGLWPTLPEWAVYVSAKVAGPTSVAWRELEKRVLADTELPRATWGSSRELIAASIVHTRHVWPVGIKPRIYAPRLIAPLRVNRGASNANAVAGYLKVEDSPLSGLPELPSHEVYWEERTMPVDRPALVAEDARRWSLPILGKPLGGLEFGCFEMEWTFAANVNEIIKPQSGSSLDEAVRRYLSPTLIRGMTTRLPAVSLIRGGVRPTELRDVALGLRITIKRGAEVAATGWCWHAGDASRPNGRADMPPVLLSVTTDDFELATAFGALGPRNVPGPEWTLTIESDSVLALRDFKASKCWQGKISSQLAECIKAR